MARDTRFRKPLGSCSNQLVVAGEGDKKDLVESFHGFRFEVPENACWLLELG